MKKIDPSLEPYLRALIYGMPGAGKTRTVCTAALDDRAYPCLYLNAKGNPLSIRDYDRWPDILDMQDLKDFNWPYNWMADGQSPDDPIVEQFDLKPPYKSLIIDQVTEVQRLSFLAQQGRVGPGDFPKKVDRQHFYNTLGQMVNFSRYFLDLPVHVFMVALEKRITDGAGTILGYAPLLWGQSDTEVGGFAYVIGRMQNRAMLSNYELKGIREATGMSDEEIERIMILAQSRQNVAKDQYGVLGDYMVNPTVTQMLDLVYGVQKHE